MRIVAPLEESLQGVDLQFGVCAMVAVDWMCGHLSGQAFDTKCD